MSRTHRNMLTTITRRRLRSLARRLLAPTWDRPNELALTEAERRDLRAVRRAMRALDEGRYGRCVGCGARIARRRLQLDPAAASCGPCERQRHRTVALAA